ncbi:hypothetical protein O6H91_07G041300 [Diphasiastrum complanatum]|uniref:Uncharacterized protein n=1 Tax=Diphasiastrum complanatum TaxID=34168 RepID=A0ACC2D4H3_DIPCM|nr:hypothetical protein O6H91_07G041300 [Diphasiastrum complanatum]
MPDRVQEIVESTLDQNTIHIYLSDFDRAYRRITRSVSSELQARLSTQPQTQEGVEGIRAVSGDMEISCFQRNSSEEIFLRSFMDGAMAPASEGMSFLSPPQPPLRVNSEELFNTWLSNTDAPGLLPLSGDYRTLQNSWRMSSELAGNLGQGAVSQPFDIPGENVAQTIGGHPDPNVRESNIGKPRNHAPSKGLPFQDHASWQMINWFQQSQPMTRSRSSELRRKYLAMQEGHKPPPSANTLQWFATQGTDELNRAVASLGAFTRALASKRPDISSTASPQLSPSPMSHVSKLSPQRNGDSVSAVVNMLKGSLERKKLAAMQQQMDKPVSPPYWRSLGQDKEDPHKPMIDSQQCISPQIDSEQQQENQKEAFSASLQITNEQFQAGVVTPHALSPSDSSGNAPGLSAGAATSEGPCNSNPAVSTQNNFIKCSGQGNWAVDETFQQNNLPSPTSNGTSNGEIPYEGALNTDYQKRQSYLSRAGSLTSSCRSGSTADAEDSTKKRRVERKRMMTEAKGRSYVPMMPSDLQAATKRCDALEKEVRSLKLNLSFMNRKDSEQTKRIEDLEKQNEELLAEKDRLVEEVRRFTSGKNFGRSS